ncbi:dUTP diphosphatase [Spiroplasma gladiatoris]|uniref:dUTP diphosphatase n=1 Tax=Spiroplasma gladiatoris TaxID=2143 RepID=A0A4P7AK85_9MOLU|nr:dUTP diphosphatase [Spiroplasma gladiatoris]QBQ07970.1 dUTP diphosphatase [Spiroplasma gladiatoris]
MLKNADISYIFEKQKILDKYIEDKWKIIKNDELLSKKIVALYVEVSEFINEQRSFKFWSNKSASSKEVLLEEYIDAIHFIFSIAIMIDYDFKDYKFDFKENEINTAYLKCFESIANFNNNKSHNNYKIMLDTFFSIAKILNFSQEDLIVSYNKKNEINFKRQDNNY